MREKCSLTVEASFVVPLSFFTVMLFMNLFLFLQVQTRVQKELAEMSTELMPYGTLLSRAGANSEKASASYLNQIGVDGLFRELGTEAYLSYRMYRSVKDERWLTYINGGATGFSFSGSSIYEKNSEIRILIHYSYIFGNRVLSFGGIPVKQQIVARGFSGVSRAKNTKKDEEDETGETMVYITDNGKVFHRTGECTYLKPSIRQITLDKLESERNSSGAKYYSCEYCGGETSEGIVFITSYGTRYHLLISCRGLLRTIHAIREEEALEQGYRPCSKCGTEE